MKIGSKVKVVGVPDDRYNPKDIEGKIISFDGKYDPILVEWENGLRNSYVEKNLIVIEE